MNIYISTVFKNKPDWNNVSTGKIDNFMWIPESENSPVSYMKLCAIENEALAARLWSYEKNIRCVNKNRDEPVYEDSCLEVFLKPFADNKNYINFEMNPLGVYLSEIGEKRGVRQHLKNLTDIEPEIGTFSTDESGQPCWGVEIHIPLALISAVYERDFNMSDCKKMTGNFYKCGDKTEYPHYAALFPAGSAELGFHNPDCFGNIVFKKHF